MLTVALVAAGLVLCVIASRLPAWQGDSIRALWHDAREANSLSRLLWAFTRAAFAVLLHVVAGAGKVLLFVLGVAGVVVAAVVGWIVYGCVIAAANVEPSPGIHPDPADDDPINPTLIANPNPTVKELTK